MRGLPSIAVPSLLAVPISIPRNSIFVIATRPFHTVSPMAAARVTPMNSCGDHKDSADNVSPVLSSSRNPLGRVSVQPLPDGSSAAWDRC
jgi:hypothetical protein